MVVERTPIPDLQSIMSTEGARGPRGGLSPGPRRLKAGTVTVCAVVRRNPMVVESALSFSCRAAEHVWGRSAGKGSGP